MLLNFPCSTLQVFTRVIHVLICSMLREVLDATPMMVDMHGTVVIGHARNTCVGFLQHGHHSMALEISLIHISLLLLLRNYLVLASYTIGRHLILRQIPAS